jgi:carbon monoxide dehydrogenase subunit G
MKISGSATLHADVDRVYKALNDPETLRAVIPGCESLEETGPDEYAMVVSVGVGSIKGVYKGRVRLSDQRAPHSFTLHAAGAGGPGTVSAECRILLVDTPEGVAHVEYDADAIVGGMVAGVGQRMLTGVAKKLAAQFFGSVDALLTGQRVGPAPAGAETGAGGRGALEPAAGQGAVAPIGYGPVAAPARPAVLVSGVAAGAVAALAGVVVGWVMGRAARSGGRR